MSLAIPIDKAIRTAVGNSAIMRIGLISDTHIPVDARKLPEQLARAFHNVDLILHAGDVYAPSVLAELGNMAPVLAARGDDDNGDVLGDERMKREHILTVEDVTIWLFHEYWENSLSANGTWHKKSGEEFQKNPDVIVYGHTHRPALLNHGSVLTVTPGSATFPNYIRQPGTVGLMTVKSGEAQAQIIPL
jgi:putative phosphoesterase